MTMTDIERIAYHEAGHAVAGYFLRLGFLRVSIISDRDSLGRLTPGAPPREVREGGFYSWSAIAWGQKATLRLLAGPAAAARAGGDPAAVLAGSDWNQAGNMALELCESEEEANAFLTWLWAKAQNFVNDPIYWRAIKALAGELLQTPEISGKRARTIIGAAWHLPLEAQPRPTL